MPDIPRLHPVTRIRGELTPRASVAKSINRFLAHPVDPEQMKLYTTAQAVVDRGEYYAHRYDGQLSEIERIFADRKLAQHVFTLTGPLRWAETSQGSGRLSFHVQHTNADNPLATFRRTLNTIRGIEDVIDEDMVYAEFSKGALAKDVKQRRTQVNEAGQLLAAELRHPSATIRMTATGLHVVTKDMMHVD